jgi:hypothetical protein
MRGIDAMVPIDLADKSVALIKAAGVPVRYEAPDDFMPADFEPAA